MPTPTVENYLKALLNLTRETGQAGMSELSQALSVSTPTANAMVKRMAEDGLIEYEKYRPLRLTEAGRRAAALVIRKHRLTEMFLVERMGFGWEQVHPIAEQIEHIQSPEFFARMDELMGYPTHDPHGSPIPDPDGNLVADEGHRRLADCRPGECVRLAALNHSANDFLHFLNERGLELGCEITVRAAEPFDGSLTVDYGSHRGVVLSRVVCEKLLVD